MGLPFYLSYSQKRGLVEKEGGAIGIPKTLTSFFFFEVVVLPILI
jgi:hypothetical protein